ncbi:TetR/AcrR family transcriptional regulator [Shewanella sp. SR44-3]|uniref:TetR/AcrR family transcriptional regulator n=1 Tax=Shewanella sp. SR44-3 TaxID=2760936 RepID=UPI0021758FFE|nr:TetR/AcrR family transcriptional regulator [Shewanella sp. SR44-3]
MSSSTLDNNSAPQRHPSKRQAILATALELFVSQGFHGSSTAQIARQAGVATGTLFHHFASKEVLMNELFLSIKQEFAEDILLALQQIEQGAGNKQPQSLKAAAHTLWSRAIDWAIANPIKQRFFLIYSMSPELSLAVREHAMHSILGFISNLLTQGQHNGEIAPFPIALMLENCNGQYLASISFFTDHPQLGQDSDYRAASFELFWRSIKA